MGGKVLLWGAKSQARIVAAELTRAGRPPDFLFDHRLEVADFQSPARFINRPEVLRRILPDCAEFVVCIGGAQGAQRAALSMRLREGWGLTPLRVISPRATIDPEADLGEGVQIMAGACIGLAARIGDYGLVNTNATVDHECLLGMGVHVMGAAAVAGRVRIGDHATIGTNATVLPDLSIGAGAQVGAGTVILTDVQPDAVMVGVPARFLRSEAPGIDLSLLNWAC